MITLKTAVLRRLAIIALILATIGTRPATAQSSADLITPASVSRTILDFDRDWKFSKGDFPAAMMPSFNDSSWRTLNLPHDWSIEGPLGAEYASGTGFAPGGVGWYRKSFRLEASATNKLVAVEFEGIYNHAEVWINGHLIGGRPYGYTSFECDLTPLLKFGEAANILAVRVDHSKFSDSRWYTGSGIYRDVHLRFTDKVHIAPSGVYITTRNVKQNSAVIYVETEIRNDSGSTAPAFLFSEILSPRGNLVANKNVRVRIPAGSNSVIAQEIPVPNPELWSIATANLYTLHSRVTNSDMVDETTAHFGIRTIRFDPDHGFSLNGVPTKIKGVCIHQDAGCLGVAVPEKVFERRLRIFKSLGVNAIRTSHNPPAPEFLDVCDRLGLLVKDEAFDEFMPAKNKWMTGWNSALPSHYGYSEDFLEWSVRDVQDMVRRDRNHPSIVMWSIGNEIDYANDPFSHPVLGDQYRPENPRAENLVKLGAPLLWAVKNLDDTRPVTAALANVAMSDAVGFADLLDIDGYNYQEARYAADHARHPRRIIFGSENHQDMSAWRAAATNEFICGQFLWTGIDYLGEAGRWPNHANGAGLLDLCGFKKPLAWFRQSLWSSQPMVYLCVSPRSSPAGQGGFARRRFRTDESWNWPSNSTVTVRCYTTCPEVELNLNGKSLGARRLADAVDGALSWEVSFEAGTLTATGRDGGKSLSEFSMKTAGPAQRIELLPDTTRITADGKDVCHVEFRIVDAAGVRLPDASDEVSFSVDGPGLIIGVENGNINSTEDYKGTKFRAFQGRGLLILQSTSGGSGAITLKAESPGLDSANITVDTQLKGGID
jgi:beta-galactosidase